MRPACTAVLFKLLQNQPQKILYKVLHSSAAHPLSLKLLHMVLYKALDKLKVLYYAVYWLWSHNRSIEC